MKLNGLEFTGKNLVIEEKKHQNDVNLPVKQDLKMSNNQTQDLVTPNQYHPNDNHHFKKSIIVTQIQFIR